MTIFNHAMSKLWIVTALLCVICIGATNEFVFYRTLSKQTEPLRVAINPFPGYEFATLAEKLGYFKDEGLDVRLVELSSLSDCRRAFERGQVQGMFSTIVEVILSQEESRKSSQVVLVTDCSNGADMILTKPDLKSIAELRGKVIGVEDASLNLVVLARALETAGLNWNDVRIVTAPQIALPRLFAEGQVDAVVSYPPMSFEIEESGANRVFTSREIPGEILDVLAFDRETIEKRPHEIAAFRRAFFKAVDFAEVNPERAYAVMADREGISVAEFRQVLTSGIEMYDERRQESVLAEGGGLQQAVEQIKNEFRKIERFRSAKVASGFSGE